jgi:YegS/Rv2252/BmrU family lipid kinase
LKSKILFIINPKSGVKKRVDVKKMINKHLDISRFDAEVIYTTHKGHAIELTRKAIEDKVDIVCAVGGDGTVHEVGTTLIGTEVKLAIIPRGSGNGMGNHLGIPKIVRKAIKTINNGVYKKMDTVLINEIPFLGVAGVGLDAIIADKFDTTEKRGLMGYVKIILKEYFSYKNITVRSKIDNGKEQVENLFICSIANGSEFGNGFCISPNSDITDGKLELFKLKRVNFFAIPAVAYRFFTRTAHQSRFVEIIPFETCELEIDQEVMHLDGEPVRIQSPFKVSIQPKSLSILTGKRNKNGF